MLCKKTCDSCGVRHSAGFYSPIYWTELWARALFKAKLLLVVQTRLYLGLAHISSCVAHTSSCVAHGYVLYFESNGTPHMSGHCSKRKCQS